MPADDRVREIQERFEHAYDPRVTWLEDRYYVTWCNGYHGPTIGVAYTHDFETFHQLDNAFLPFNRNGVLFPRRIGGRYAMLSRPSDNGHTPVRRHLLLGEPRPGPLGSPPPRHGAAALDLAVDQGRRGPDADRDAARAGCCIYHGVLTSCNGFVYSMGAALLDLDEPWKVIARGRDYLLSPQVSYEQVGDVPNVVFPCAALVDQRGRPPDHLLRGGGHGRVHGPLSSIGDHAVPRVLTSPRVGHAESPARAPAWSRVVGAYGERRAGAAAPWFRARTGRPGQRGLGGKAERVEWLRCGWIGGIL